MPILRVGLGLFYERGCFRFADSSMSFDLSDSDDNLIDQYQPDVKLPSVIPAAKVQAKPNSNDKQSVSSSTNSEKNTGNSNGGDTDSSESFDFELYASKKKNENSGQKRTRRNKQKNSKNSFTFKPAPSEKLEKRKIISESDDENFEKLDTPQINPEDVPDVVFDDEEESSSDGPLENVDWTSKNKAPVQRRPETNQIEPQPPAGRPRPHSFKVKPPSERMPLHVSTSSGNFITPPKNSIMPPSHGSRPRPRPNKKKSRPKEEAESLSEDSAPVFSSHVKEKMKAAVNEPTTERKQAPVITEDLLDMQKVHMMLQKAQDEAEDEAKKKKKVDLEFKDYIASIETQGQLTKRTFVRLFEGITPLYSVKFKNSLADGNFNVSVGANAHIKNGQHYATIIVANDKTDFSLRHGTFEGQELATIRTTVSDRDGRSGHAIFIHGIPGVGPIDLVGFWAGSSTIEFREKFSNDVYVSLGLLSGTMINCRCCQFIDPARCLAICFAMFVTRK